MNNQEAKFILRAYRPSGADAEDPAFADALAQARTDPSLAKWFDKELAFDRAVAKRIQGTPVPAGLRTAILAGGKVSQTKRSWWRQPIWLAMAASIAVVLGSLFWWPNSARADAALAHFALDDLRRGHPGAGKGGADVATLEARLGDTAKPLSQVVSDLEKMEPAACRRLQWSGHTVFEVCFSRGTREYHFYFMRRGELPNAAETPEYAEASGLSAVTWSDARYVYAVAGAGGVAALKQLL